MPAKAGQSAGFPYEHRPARELFAAAPEKLPTSRRNSRHCLCDGLGVPMTSILQWLENTSLSTTLRDSPNVFLYPTILAFHTLGLAFFVGLSSAIALRVLGVAPGLPLAPFRQFYPVMWLGFVVN